MSHSWAKLDTPKTMNFEDIMSEELARDLQEKENKMALKSTHETDFHEDTQQSSDILKENSCESDEMIAQMLQIQFDKEYDEELKRVENKYNGTSKVSISFDNYKRTPQNFDFESDSEEEIVDVAERKNWDRFDVLKKEIDSIPACGYKMVDGAMITKHDVVMSGRKNACKLLSFPPEFQTGDGEDLDLKLSNKVFNNLKRYSQHEEAKRHKLKDKKEDRATAEFGLDEFTSRLLLKLIEQEYLEKINGIVSIGKESVILHAESNPNYTECELPPDCVIKVYKTTLAEFKQREKYIRDDYRFKDRMGKQTARKTINLWAEKEMHNLNRLKNAGILCPDVVVLKKHVLVMSMIGSNHLPSPKLKDAKMSMADYILAYDQIIQGMKTLFQKAELIHADLSEYNILWHDQNCYFIDVSQAVMPSHTGAADFLKRDCDNITTYFSKKHVPKILTSEELFNMISDGHFGKRKQIANDIKLKPHLMDRLDFVEGNQMDFNVVWNQTQDQIEDVKLVNPSPV